ncbi:MAG TPA: Hsp70 family protein, partial [Polyangiaceae bacterium]
MAEAFLHAHRYDPRADPQAFERLRVVAETMKIELSAQERAQTRLREVAFGVGGAHLDLDFGMTRDELEMLATPLVERTFAVCQEALSVARLPVSAFDKVILVGGSTRIPLVRRRVEQFFGTPPLDRVNPEEVVAIGAAIQAAALTEVARRRSIPPPPARKSYPSRPIVDDEAEPTDEVTLATKVTALMAEAEKVRPPLPSQTDGGPTSPLPRTTARMGAPPPLPPARTARLSVPDVAMSPGTTQPIPSPPPPPPPTPPQLAAAIVPLPPTPPIAPPSQPDPAATIPKPLMYEDVLRAERASSGPPAKAPAIPPAAPPEPVIRTPPPPSQPAFTSAMSPPVLVDVTPRALVVETVGGWCDVIVQRNSKIPCERTRAYTTSSDMQTVVKVRVAQGEEAVFGGNTYLGEVELSSIRPAPRGQVTIEVRFAVDESGSLQVFAKDVGTGREAHATLQLVGIAGAQSVSSMRARQAAMRVH